jgi:hypothetical protein
VKRRRRPYDTADAAEQPIRLPAVAAVRPEESEPPSGHHRQTRGVPEVFGPGEARGAGNLYENRRRRPEVCAPEPGRNDCAS